MRRWGRHHTGWRESSFSRRSPLSICMRARRAFLASKETPTIMEFPRAFNEEPFRLHARRPVLPKRTLLLARGLHRIMSWNKTSSRGGLRHAPKKTHRRRNLLAPAQGKRLERGERQAAP